MIKYELPSNKILSLETADTESALSLLRLIIKRASLLNIDFNIKAEDTLKDVLVKNQALLMSLISEEDINEAILLCGAKALYGKQKIIINGELNKELFEDPAARNDYIGIMYLIAMETLEPFFPSLHTLFQTARVFFVKS